MAKRLGDAISSICRGNGDVELFEGFLQDFVDCAGFLDYFEARWLPRLGQFMYLSFLYDILLFYLWILLYLPMVFSYTFS